MQPGDQQTQPSVMPSGRGGYFWPLVGVGFFAILLLGFGVWAYLGKNDAQTNLDGQISDAVQVAEAALSDALTLQFDEESKLPHRTVKLADELGGVTFEFPKNWGVYVIDKGSGSKPLDLWAHPNVVPDISGETSFGLRMQIVDDAYSDELGDFDREIENGEVSSQTARSNGALGVKLQGEVVRDKIGIMVMFPLRDKTLKLWTESSTYKADFETALEGLVFTP